MMHKRLKFFIGGKAPKFAPAAVTAGHGRDFAVHEPIDEGKKRKAQAVGPRDQDDPNRHNKTAQGLIKICGDVKLAAGAARAALKYSCLAFKLSPNMFA